MKTSTVLLAAALAFFIEPAVARTQDNGVDNDYSFAGKTITVEVGFAPGGAAATEAMVVAKRLGEFVPGHPAVIVGYRPGGGGRVLNNYLYNIAPANGLELGRLDNSVAIANLLDDSAIKYDAAKFAWLGSFVPDGWAFFLRQQTGLPSVSALQSSKKSLKIASISAVHKTYSNARLLQAIFGFRFDMITGYPSGRDIELAASRGEIDGAVSAINGFMQRSFGQFRDGALFVPLQSGLGENHQPMKGLENVPTIWSVVPPSSLPLLKVATLPWDSPFVAPPRTPAPIVAELRSALERLSRDASFRSEYEKTVGLPVDFTPGERIADDIVAISRSPRSVAEALQALYR